MKVVVEVVEMKRVFVIGLDALSPKLAERFAKDGTCPNFKRIMDNGCFSKALSAVPAQTPENWTTIATGSWPGTHGIATWGRHSYGEPVTEIHGDEAMSSNLCKAEYLWEAAARQGLKSVLHYFVGYPPTTDMTIHVDWFWRPGIFYFEICSNACYVSDTLAVDVKGNSKTTLIPIKFREAEGWVNVPKVYSPPLETEIKVLPNVGGRGVSYYALLLDVDGCGYQMCLLSKDKDCSKALCTLKEGEWSGWFRETFVVEGEDKVGTVRFKLVELSRDGGKFKLYRSQVYPVSGFTHPPKVAERLVERFGPYINDAVSWTFFRGLVDEQTFIEEFEYQIRWIADAAGYLMNKGASLYMMHWHLLDTLEHRILGSVDPVGGKYNSEKAEEAWRILRLGYRIADELVGEFLKYLDEETYLIVVSDHGSMPQRKRYSIVKALADRGLVEVEEHKGTKRVNWAKSKIFISLTNVYVNLKSKYKGGVVEDSEYENVRREVIDVLRSCKDQYGDYVIAFALRREDAPMIGLWGEHVGDVVFAYSPTFAWGHVDFLNEGSTIIGGASHGPMIPTAETEISSNYATFMMIGKNVKKGYVRPVDMMGPVQLVDVAPTVSYILGIEPPKHCQGRVLYDFFEGWDISEMKREQRPLRFPVKRPLVGDVTDRELSKDAAPP